MDFHNNNNVIKYGGEGQPSYTDIDMFLSKISYVMDLEIAAFGLGSTKESNSSAILVFGTFVFDPPNTKFTSSSPSFKKDRKLSGIYDKKYGVDLTNARWVKYHIHTEPGGDRDQSQEDIYHKDLSKGLPHYFLIRGKREKY